jgi:aminoglycoside 2'-N-acetyltransferase I
VAAGERGAAADARSAAIVGAMVEASSAVVRRLATSALGPRLEREVRNLLERTFAGTDEGDFTDEDWRHSIGGMHFLIDHLGSLAGHASVVERRLEVGGRPVRTGYVEAVAIAPAL